MPTATTLTDHICRSAAITDDKPQKLFDAHGLYLYLTKAGAKVWRMAYRQHGKQQTATFGPYPLVSLAEARRKRDALRLALVNGEPIKRRNQKRGLTLETATREYWEGRLDVTDGYRSNAMRGIEMHLWPALGSRAIATITRADLMAELNRMDKAGLVVYVRKVRMWAKMVFAWAVEHGHCETNPAMLIDPAAAFSRRRVVSHAALPEHQVHEFLERLAMEGDLNSVLMCRMLALTWARTGEVRRMEWSEIQGSDWIIPEGKMKRRLDHLVPLPTQAVGILRLMKARNRGGKYVFEADHRPDRPLSENAVLEVIKRIGYKDRMTGHGWRSVGSTWANGRQWNADAIERQLAHVPGNIVRSAYNRAEYIDIRRPMLQAYADWLLGTT